MDGDCLISYQQIKLANKRKGFFEQNVLIQIILRMRKVSSRPLLSIHSFCSIQ